MPNRPHMLNWERNWCPATDQRGRSLHLLPLKARLLIAGSAERKDTGTATKLSWDCKVPFWSLHTNEPREQTNSIKGCRMAATPWHIGKASIGTFWTAAGLHLIRTGSTCILRIYRVMLCPGARSCWTHWQEPRNQRMGKFSKLVEFLKFLGMPAHGKNRCTDLHI